MRDAARILLEVADALGHAHGAVAVEPEVRRQSVVRSGHEREKAIESYRFVTEAWRRPDPELQPYVSEARDGLARLAPGMSPHAGRRQQGLRVVCLT